MIQPGLARISQLLKNVEFPWRSIHVAGTNGKGSICHYASLLIKSKKIKVGKFTSPHLVDRWDCITVGNKPVDETAFRKVEKHYQDLNLRDGIGASPFEILTATAFHMFNDAQIKIGVIEVGMGGKDDATNILNNQAVSVISRIDRDHQSFLGNTLEKIALHKAGILRPEVPYIVNPNNEQNVIDVIDGYASTINAGPPLSPEPPDLRKTLFNKQYWKTFTAPLTPAQLDNVVLAAVAARQAVETIGLDFRAFDIGSALLKSRVVANPGRMELVRVPLIFGDLKHPRGQKILVDGAHNPNAATALKDFVSIHRRINRIKGQHPGRAGWPVTWVLAMTEGKDAHEYLRILLQPGDNVITTTFGPVDGMPSVKPMDPKQLLDIAKSVQPGVTGIAMPKEGALRALCAAKFISGPQMPVVLTGSLYLVGDFHRELRSRSSPHYWNDPEFEQDRKTFKLILKEEEQRVNRWLSAHSGDSVSQISDEDKKENTQWNKQIFDREKKRAIQQEMEALDKELESLTAKEARIGQQQPSNGKGRDGPTASKNAASAGEPEPSTERQDRRADIPGKTSPNKFQSET